MLLVAVYTQADSLKLWRKRILQWLHIYKSSREGSGASSFVPITHEPSGYEMAKDGTLKKTSSASPGTPSREIGSFRTLGSSKMGSFNMSSIKISGNKGGNSCTYKICFY